MFNLKILSFSCISLLALSACSSNLNYSKDEIGYSQSQNKESKCLVYTHTYKVLNNNLKALWQGECQDGFAIGDNLLYIDDKILELQHYDNKKAELYLKYDLENEILFQGYDDYLKNRIGRITYFKDNKEIISFQVYELDGNNYTDYKKVDKNTKHLSRAFKDKSKLSFYNFLNNQDRSIYVYNSDGEITHRIVKDHRGLSVYVKDFGFLQDKERAELLFESYTKLESDLDNNFKSPIFKESMQKSYKTYLDHKENIDAKLGKTLTDKLNDNFELDLNN